jgi:hypothetical protein
MTTPRCVQVVGLLCSYPSDIRCLCAGVTQAWPHIQVDFLGESTTGNLHLVGQEQDHSIGNVLGLASVEDIVDMPVNELRRATKVLYHDTVIVQ